MKPATYSFFLLKIGSLVTSTNISLLLSSLFPFPPFFFNHCFLLLLSLKSATICCCMAVFCCAIIWSNYFWNWTIQNLFLQIKLIQFNNSCQHQSTNYLVTFLLAAALMIFIGLQNMDSVSFWDILIRRSKSSSY